MKIALVANHKGWIVERDKRLGGGNIVSNNIFKVLKERGHEIIIIMSGDLEDETDGNVTVKYINHPVGSTEFSQEALKISSQCDRTINFMTQNIFSGVILQSHSYLYRTQRTNKILIPLKRLLYGKKIKEQNRRFSQFPIDFGYAVSEGVKNDFEKNLGLKNIKVSHLGTKRVYQEFNGEKNDVLTFGLIANSSSNKSGHYCVFALWLAKLSGLKFRFKMIAPKYDSDLIMKFLLNISGLRKVTDILPKQEDMTDFYKSIDCVLMPSIHESFGLVPLEALSFCKTCLVSDNIGFAEIIDENSGFKFNRLSISSFLKQLKYVGKMFYETPEEFDKIRKNGWEISTKYTWERFVDGLIN